MILPLNSPHAQLGNAGGKGANLSRLVRAGLPVPDGFIITTEAYQKFVDENYLGDRISQRVSKIQSQDSSALEEASEEIRSWFMNSNIPPQIATQAVDAYHNLGEAPVAVRSSATAEDLPELSFAGQHDTYLNILGAESLLEAMLYCWSSLWTARAIGYRSRNNIPQAEISLAVVVQKMIPSESSGILFTANPLTGLRTESVIDATLGLGEALVAGHVEPDHYVVDQNERVIISKSLGSKKIAMHGKSDGGVLTEEIEAQKTQALPDKEILSLVDLGGKVTDLFKFPQDIEWGYSNGDLVLLQSRPITSLFPIPEGMSPVDLRVLISFASIQGIMDPLTPLGQDTIHMIFAGGASLFGYDLIPGRQGLFKPAGERLWGDITAVIRHPIGSRLVLRFLTVVDPVAQTNLAALKGDPGLAFGKGQLRFATFQRLFRFVYPFLKRVFHHIRSPQGTAEQIQQASQVEIARIKGKSEAWQEAVPTLAESLDLYREIYNAFPFAIPEIATGAAGGLIPFFLLNKIATNLTGSSDLGLEITRGLPNNVTTEMDLALWETAHRIRSDDIAYQHFLDSNPEILARDYLNNQLPETAQSNLTKFLEWYGMRGLGEIDIGRKRWNEDPTYVFEVLLQYIKIEDRSLAPDVVFKKGEQAAEKALKELQEIA
jgi:pyruvate,water dikinase